MIRRGQVPSIFGAVNGSAFLLVVLHSSYLDIHRGLTWKARDSILRLISFPIFGHAPWQDRARPAVPDVPLRSSVALRVVMHGVSSRRLKESEIKPSWYREAALAEGKYQSRLHMTHRSRAHLPFPGAPKRNIIKGGMQRR